MKEVEQVLLNDNTIIYGYKDDYITNIIKNTGDYYETYCLKKFTQYIPEKAVIYDIGANIGNHTLYFSKYSSPRKILCFEPVKITYDLLIRNIESNNINNISTYNLAVGEKKGKSIAILNESNLGGSRVEDMLEGDIDIIDLDNFGDDIPNFIKIDVEGYEIKVIKGMENILKNHSPVLWIEIFKENFKLIDKILAEFNYALVEKIEDNYIYIKAITDDEKKIYTNRFKNNIISYYDTTINEARKKYRDLNIKYSSIKEKLDVCNNKYREVTLKVKELEKELERYKERNNNVEAIREEIKELRDILVNHYSVLCGVYNDISGKDKIIAKQDEKIQELININNELEFKTKELNKTNKELEARVQELVDINSIQEKSIKEHSRLISQKNQELKELGHKALDYLNYIERLNVENNELTDKRRLLIERTEELYSNNQKLVEELKDIKARYKALSGSKLGKLTIRYWKLKRRRR